MNLRCSVWNVYSLNNKVNDVMNVLADHESDIVFFTETWLTDERNKITSDIKDHGYTLKHNIRLDRDKDRGGGVGIAFRSTLRPVQIVSKFFSSFEYTAVRLPCKDNNTLILISVYRLQDIDVSIFLDEFSDLLEMHTVLHDSFIIAGDINIHVETENTASRKFHELLDMFHLKQHVADPTHIKGHTLDVVITRKKKNLVSDLVITENDLSHHSLIDFVYKAAPLQIVNTTINYRNIKSIVADTFSEDIRSALSNCNSVELGEKVDHYNSSLRDVLDKHAPVKTKEIRILPNAPWFDEEYAALRRQRRKAEKTYSKTKSIEHRAQYHLLRQNLL